VPIASPSRRRQPQLYAVGLAGVILLALTTPRLVAAVAGRTAPESLLSAQALKQRGFAAAVLAGTDNDKAGLARSAEHDLTAGLARAPADPAAWAALAALRGGGDGAPALALSLSTGPREGPEFWSRLELCLADQEAIGRTLDSSLVQEQIRIGWRAAPARLVELVRRHSAVALAKTAFAGRPGSGRFAAMLDGAG
jgi:hypothetical protein